MKDRKIFIPMAAALALAAGVTSCSNDDELLSGGTTTEGRTPIILTSNVVAAGSRTVDQTLQDTYIATGQTVGVFALTEDGEYIENGNNNMLTATEDGGFTGTEMYFDADEVYLYAYAPYSSSWTSQENTSLTFTVATDQSTESGYYASDLMIGAPSSNPVASTTEEIELTFKHMLTKLNINIELSGDDSNGGSTNTIDLQGATVEIYNVLPSITVNVSTGELGNASGSATSITAAEFDDDATTFTASAIFVPQTVASGTTFVMVTTADGVSYKATLDKEVEFKSGVKYTYKMTINGTNATITAVTQTTDWDTDDTVGELGGTATVTVTYGVGDYLLSDGTFVKNENLSTLSDEEKAKIVAVIFSTDVSDTDAGTYDAYAMGLWRFTQKSWGITDVAMNGTYSTYANAYKDLDGLTKTKEIFNSDEYTALTDDEKSSNFVNYTGYTTSHPLPTDGTTSEWFTPSFGQMIQIFNNLGNAGLTENMTLPGEGNYSSAMYYTDDTDVLDNINKYVNDAGGDTEMFITATNDTESTISYITVTELNESTCWAFSTRNVSVSNVLYEWGFGRNGTKSNTGRSVAPCVAVTLPDPE